MRISAKEGYFAHFLGRGAKRMEETWRIARRSFRFGAQETQSEVWSREFALKGFSGILRLSDDSAWLAVRDWTLRVLDVFDMSNIQLDSQPDFRVEVGYYIPCGTCQGVAGQHG